jgi:internalin A
LANLRDLVIEDSVTIVDWGTLAGLTSLESLVLTWRELEYEPRGSLADLSPLFSLQKLTRLCLEHQRISDIGPLAALPGLVELSLRDNQVSDLTPLAGLDSVRTLDLYANPVLELDPLVGMPTLESLTVPDAVSCHEVNDFATARPDILLNRPEGPCPP